MWNKIVEIIQNAGSAPSVRYLLVSLIMALVAGLFISLCAYIAGRRHTGNRFSVLYAILTLVAAAIVLAVKANIAAALGGVAALLILQFVAPKETEGDGIFMVWAVGCGVCCGAEEYIVAGIGCAAVFLVLLVFGLVRKNDLKLIVIKGKLDSRVTVQGLVFRLLKKQAVLRVNSAAGDSYEIMYEVPGKVLEKVEKSRVNLPDTICGVEGVESVRIIDVEGGK